MTINLREAPADSQAPTRRRPRRDPQGSPGRPHGPAGGPRPARRAAAPARPADRISPSDSRPLRLYFGQPSGRAGGRDEDGAGRGLRGRDLLCAFRRGEGRPAAAARHRAGVRFTVLRNGRRRPPGGVAGRENGPQGQGLARALHGRLRLRAGGRDPALAGQGGDPGSDRCGGRHPRLRRHHSGRARISPPIRPMAAIGSFDRVSPANARAKGRSRRSTTPACAAAAAPAFRPGANGAWCAPSPVRA